MTVLLCLQISGLEATNRMGHRAYGLLYSFCTCSSRCQRGFHGLLATDIVSIATQVLAHCVIFCTSRESRLHGLLATDIVSIATQVLAHCVVFYTSRESRFPGSRLGPPGGPRVRHAVTRFPVHRPRAVGGTSSLQNHSLPQDPSSRPSQRPLTSHCDN